MATKSTLTIGLGAALTLSVIVGLFPTSSVMAQVTQPPPTQSACIQRANAAFTSAVVAAIQQITTGTLTHNQALVTAGTTALNNAITTYNAAIAACVAPPATTATR